MTLEEREIREETEEVRCSIGSASFIRGKENKKRRNGKRRM